MGSEKVLDFFVAVIFIVGITTLGVKSLPLFASASEAGFGTSIEKSAPTTQLEIEPKEHIMKIEDISLAILLLDDFHPEPDTIKVMRFRPNGNLQQSSIVFNIDIDFLNHRAQRIKNMNTLMGAHLPSNHTVDYRLEVDALGSVSWVYEIRE